MFNIASHTSEILFLMLSHVSAILSFKPLNHSLIPSIKPPNHSPTPAKNSFIASHISMTLFLKSSLFCHNNVNATTRPAIAATTIPIGLAAKTVFNAVKATVTFLIIDVKLIATANTPNAVARPNIIGPKVSILSTSFVINLTALLIAGISFSLTSILKPSHALLSFVTSPVKLSSCVSAICAAAPSELSIASVNSSQRCVVVPNKALTDFKSCLLKVFDMISVLSFELIPSNAPFISLMMSFNGRILPSAS